MPFVKVRQATLTGERKAYVNVSAIAYIQEIIPDQDITWQTFSVSHLFASQAGSCYFLGRS